MRWAVFAGTMMLGCSQPTPPTAKAVPEEMVESVDASPPAPGPTERPDLALALVLDRSGSMMGQKIDVEKSAAKDVSDALLPKDVLDVIAFDSTPTRIVALRPAAEKLVNDAAIDRIAAGGGTDLLPALQRAYVDLASVTAVRKHIVVVTDGQSPTGGLAEVAGVAAAEGITVSTLALGSDADNVTLQAIAANGGGRFYLVADPNALPDVLAQEVGIVRPGW